MRIAYDTRPPLDRRTQVTYGLGTLAYGVKNQAMGSMLLLYFNQVVGLPATWVGAAIALALVVDAVLDPFIGYFSDNLQISFIISTGFVAPFLAVALAPPAGARLGKKWAVVTLWMIGAAVALVPISPKLLDWLPPNGSPVVLGLLAVDALVVATLTLSGLILGASMVADLAEETAVKTGRRSEGVLFSADAIIKQSIIGLGTFLAGLMLAVVEFPDGAVPGELDPTIMRHLAYLYLPAAAILNLASIGALAFYSNDRESHEANLALLRAGLGKSVSGDSVPPA